ncbi:type II toxin-antitoxin system VapC family toxin [Paraburkholderia sp. Ac-20342]|uniref:type II toxin-antitoxin system VapC family toxin n=1 Tax=Paraburkholderia sp. Ac-20342 TaxID=2703889 RepID=UPI00198225A3|nr:type II toxin-antitoxin system VapC family toxin [Paraburkholderia sp. Ac-20342]
MIVFFDANALIYLLEGKEPFASRVRAELEAVYRAHPGVGSAVSRLSWFECRVGPMKTNDVTTLASFDAFFARPDLIWQELNREVVELAAAIRVRHGLRTSDALQAACCLQLGSDHMFLTGDSAFQRVHALNVALLT